MNFPSAGAMRPTLVLVAAIALAGMARADDGAALSTPDGLVQAVLETNPGLQAMQAAVDEARARADAAGRLADPTLAYLSAPETIGSRIGTRHIVQIGQAVPWPGTLADRRARGQALGTARRHASEDYRLQLARSARTLFAEWQYAHAGLAVNRQQQLLVSEMIEAARGRYSGGRGSQQEVLQAQLQAEQLKQSALDWAQRIETLAAQINALLNRPADAALPRPVDAFDDDRPEPAPPNTHPAVAELDAERRSREVEVALAERARYPEFRLMANYLGTLDPDEKRLQLGASINLPIQFGRQRADEDAARAALARSRYRLEDRRAQLSAERAAALAAHRRADRSAELLETGTLPLAVDNLNAALADYRSGRGSFLNVIDAQQRQLRAELDLNRARADRARAIADWQRWAPAAAGGPTADLTGDK